MSTSPEDVCLTPAQQQYLARLADQSGRPWQEVLGEALATFASQTARDSLPQESVYDAMVRLNLLGSVADSPADLSTNPKYMNGFGESGS